MRVGARQCVSQLSAGTDDELGEHVVQMPLNSPRAEKQPRTDLRIRKPIACHVAQAAKGTSPAESAEIEKIRSALA